MRPTSDLYTIFPNASSIRKTANIPTYCRIACNEIHGASNHTTKEEIALTETLYPFITAFATTVLLIPLIIVFAKKRNLVDKPNSRKIHKQPVPLMGGLGIYLGFITAIFSFIRISTPIIVFLISCTILMIVGLIDDLYNIRANMKLVVHIVCALLVILSGSRIHVFSRFIQDPIIVLLCDSAVTLIWIIGIINAINLVDGLDGLAGGISIIAALGFAFVAGYQQNSLELTLSFILAGATLGFLVYNLNPAKIFMGDAGSTLLGFTLAILSISSANASNEATSLCIPVIILAVPIFDTGVSILRRLLRGQGIFVADKDHLHHKLLERGFNQKNAVAIMDGLAVAAGVAGMTIYFIRNFTAGLFIIIALLVLGFYISIKNTVFFRVKSELVAAKQKDDMEKR